MRWMSVHILFLVIFLLFITNPAESAPTTVDIGSVILSFPAVGVGGLPSAQWGRSPPPLRPVGVAWRAPQNSHRSSLQRDPAPSDSLSTMPTDIQTKP
jgi:hypothetical protein